MHTSLKQASLTMLFLLIGFTATVAQPQEEPIRYRRANPPKWNARDISGLFFADALREGVRERRASSAESDGKPAAGRSNSTTTGSVPRPYSWSILVSPSTLEDEVKNLKPRLDNVVTTPGKFAGGGYIEARHHFTTLALIFGVISEYDDDVRWKRDAATARDLFAHTASIAKVGTIQVFNAAKQRKLDLGDLVRGARLTSPTSCQTNNWSDVVDRPPLMIRLELAVDERLAKWTATVNELRANRDRLVHESEIAAIIAESLTREGMEDSDDDDYAEYCRQLKEAARQVIDAAKQQDHIKARQAVGAMKQSCDECHETYRG